MTRNSTGKVLRPLQVAWGKNIASLFIFMALSGAHRRDMRGFFNKVVLGQAFSGRHDLSGIPHRISRMTICCRATFLLEPVYVRGSRSSRRSIPGFVPDEFILSFLRFPMTFLVLTGAVSVLHLAIAGMTMFICAVVLGVKKFVAFCRVQLYAVRFFVVHVIHSLILSILAWLPLIMAFLKKGTESASSFGFFIAASSLACRFSRAPSNYFLRMPFLGAYGITFSLHRGKRVPWRFTWFYRFNRGRAEHGPAPAVAELAIFPQGPIGRSSRFRKAR